MKIDKIKELEPFSPKIEYHADDFGLFLNQSKRIMDCYHSGNLNGVSIFPNSASLDACMELLHPAWPRVAVTVHLNFMEGRCMTVPMKGMTDENGILQLSFGPMLLRSFLPGQAKWKAWLKAEISAQIHAVRTRLPEGMSLRLDGHAHYHMLPLIFDAMIEVIREENLPVSYIRIPREYPLLYLRHIRNLKDFALVNVVKVWILNILADRNDRKHKAYLETLERKLFLGVFLSGRMYRENLLPILPGAIALARKKGLHLELLAHPGGVSEAEDQALITSRDDLAFLTSPMRGREVTLYQLESE